MEKRKEIWEYGIVTILSTIAFLAIMGCFTGKGLFDHNPYNTYALQADSWRQGRLDLSQDYPWLELAIFNEKYYCSFPPFPSYLLFPLTFIWGSNTPDFFLLFVFDLIIAAFLYKLAIQSDIKPAYGMLEAFLALFASNMVFIIIDPSVWFLAQTTCFMLSLLAIFYGRKGNAMLSLLFFSCSVGCRPMQAVFLPVLLYWIYRAQKEREPELSVGKMIRQNIWCVVPAAVIGFSYMVLNYARFGNIMEFGHNYLPEFVRSEKGQFSVSYIADNLRTLFALPEFAEDGKMVINTMGNLSVMIVSPIVAIVILLMIITLLKKEKKEAVSAILVLVFSCVYMLIVVMHKTMGGWHFGNRYSNDILPWIYAATLIMFRKHPEWMKYQIPCFIFSFCLNVTGTIAVYNGWV